METRFLSFRALRLQTENVVRHNVIHVTGGGFTSKRGTFGNIGKLETMMSVSYGRIEDLVFSGAATGDIYIWKDILLLKTVKAHDGPVFAMHALDKVFILYSLFSVHCFLYNSGF